MSRIPILGIVPASLPLSTLLAVIVTATLLDVFVYRPFAASVTTLLPGTAYATKAFILVSTGAGVLAGAAALASRGRLRCERIPRWAALSLAAVPVAPLAGTSAVLIAQRFAQLPHVAQAGVVGMMSCVAAGLVAGLIALLRHERPGALAMLGVATNAVLLCVFRYFEFYKLGFDQDRWAG